MAAMRRVLKKPAFTVLAEMAPGDRTPSSRMVWIRTMPKARDAKASRVL